MEEELAGLPWKIKCVGYMQEEFKMAPWFVVQPDNL